MCPQFKISAEFFSFFCDGWIELVELHRKKYVSNFILKTYFTKKVQATIIFQYQRNRPKIWTAVRHIF